MTTTRAAVAAEPAAAPATTSAENPDDMGKETRGEGKRFAGFWWWGSKRGGKWERGNRREETRWEERRWEDREDGKGGWRDPITRQSLGHSGFSRPDWYAGVRRHIPLASR